MPSNQSIDQKRGILRISAKTMKSLDDCWHANKKIAAIKILRAETKCGLKEAKQAIEKRYEPKKWGHTGAFDIMPMMTIKGIIIDCGEGEVTMTLDEYHMMSLMKLEKIGIEECRRLIELHDKLMEWQGLSPTGAITTGALGEDDD